MKNILFAATFTAAFLYSCGGSKTGSEAVDSTKTGAIATTDTALSSGGETPQLKHFHHYEKDFQNLTLGLRGLVRTIDLGDDVAYIKANEKGELTKESATELVYKAKLSEDESVDITYTIKDGKVNAILLSVTMGTIDELITMMGEFTDFYTQKFGFPAVTADGNEIWKPSDSTSHEIDIVDKSASGKNILEIVIK